MPLPREPNTPVARSPQAWRTFVGVRDVDSGYNNSLKTEEWGRDSVLIHA